MNKPGPQDSARWSLAGTLEECGFNQPGHRWHRDGLSGEQTDRVRAFHEKRYQQ